MWHTSTGDRRVDRIGRRIAAHMPVLVFGGALVIALGVALPAAFATAPPAPSTVASQQTQPQSGAQVPQPSVDDSPRYDSAWISEMQGRLAQRGYDPGPATGTFGRATADAIAAFQRDQGLKETGLPAPSVMERLRRGAVPASTVSAPTTHQKKPTTVTTANALAATKSHRIQRLDAKTLQLARGLGYTLVRGGDYARMDATIFKCAGIREPIRDNFEAMLIVALPNKNKMLKGLLNSYDKSYEWATKSLEQTGCTPDSAASAYRGYEQYLRYLGLPLTTVTAGVQQTTASDRNTAIENLVHEIHVNCLNSTANLNGYTDCACVKQNATKMLADGVQYDNVRKTAWNGCEKF